jgi:hypothetical protein
MRVFPTSRRASLAAVSCSSLISLLAGTNSACSARHGEETGSASSAVWNLGSTDYTDQSDADDPASNIVVSIAKSAAGPSVCTGTLLTPRLVLTAASCKNDAKAGALPRVGGRIPYRQTVAASAFLTFGTPATEPSLSGMDVGVIVLSADVFEPARIHHPPLTAPAPLGPPAQGGLEAFANVGMAGWATLDPGMQPISYAQKARQALLTSQASLWRYWNISSSHEPFWVYKVYTDDGTPKYGLSPADNGGPLFVTTSDGSRRLRRGVRRDLCSRRWLDAQRRSG